MGVIIKGKEIYINGERIAAPPENGSYVNITTIGNKVFVNGFEYKRGKWKRTLRALWHLIF